MAVYYDEKRKTYFVKTSYINDLGERKQTTKRGFKLKREAKNWEVEFLKKMNGSSSMTFKSLTNIYIEDCENRLKETTLAGKKYLIETKVAPYFDSQPIQEIDAKMIRRWQNWLLKQETKKGKKLSQTYIKTINNQLSAILNFGVKFYGLKTNPMHLAGSIGKKQADSMDFWTLQEFNTFLKVVKDKPQNEICFSLLFYTGMRIGELLALTQNDFDYSDKSVSINKSFTRLNKKDIISEPKTEKSKRVVNIPDHIFPLLDDYISKLYDYHPEERLFDNTKHYFRYEITRGAKLSGVKRIRVHDLRHSHASLLIELGVSPLMIQQRLGHEDIETTLNTYSHLYPNKEEEVMNKLKEVIERSQEEKNSQEAH